MRAVVDINVWVSSQLSRLGIPARVRQAYRDGRFAHIVSEPLLADLAEVLMPGLRFGMFGSFSKPWTTKRSDSLLRHVRRCEPDGRTDRRSGLLFALVTD